MKIRRLLLPVFLGALVGAVVMVWPVRPMWVAKTETWPEFVGLADDERTIITQHSDKQHFYCRWDLRKGELLGRHLLDSPVTSGFHVSVSLMGDQRDPVCSQDQTKQLAT